MFEKHEKPYERLKIRICAGINKCKDRLYNPDMEDCKACASKAVDDMLAVPELEMTGPKHEPLRFEPIPEYGDKMTVKEFFKACISGAFIDEDGHGYYATEDQMTNIKIHPSLFTGVMEHKYPYVVWFNK